MYKKKKQNEENLLTMRVWIRIYIKRWPLHWFSNFFLYDDSRF